MVVLLVALCIIAIIAAVLVMRRLGGGNFPWIQFYTKGKESGFSFHEINLLRKVAVENRLENPTSLFWSIKQLDRSIKGTMIKFRSEGTENDDANVNFLSKLFDFRRRVELNLPKYTIGLKTSRKISTGQRVKITLPGVGTYGAAVVENLRKYLALSYPEGPKLPQGFSWKNQKINIYFWRLDDAGYVFETRVIDDFFDQKYPIIHILHSDNIVRSQKRRSVRVETSRAATLYPLKTTDQASEEVETTQGLKCRLVDISEDGAAVLVGGRAKVGLTVKLQFAINGGPLVMSGVVKGVSFNQKKNQSVLHLQAIPLKPKTRNKVLSYVYNLFQERDDEQKATTGQRR
jgi:c-di-GMP-binding flagellar brake protein YcgR